MLALHSAHYMPILDHVMELSLVASAVEAALCTPLLADQTKQTVQAKKAVLWPITSIANDANNNLFLINAEVDQFVSWDMISMR